MIEIDVIKILPGLKIHHDSAGDKDKIINLHGS